MFERRPHDVAARRSTIDGRDGLARSCGERRDGHPVLALPGFLASDLSMAPMRRYLKELGYDAYAWNMGRNFGGISSRRTALRDLLKRVHEASGRKVSIIGWSLGGVYARDLASQMPELVRSIVTLGSPFAEDIRATNATRLYELLSGERVDDIPEVRAAIAGDMPVPTTSIYTRADGIVRWADCLNHDMLLRVPTGDQAPTDDAHAVKGLANTDQRVSCTTCNL